MVTRRVRTARDYNRGLPPPVAFGHAVAALVCQAWRAIGPLIDWARQPQRRFWALPLFLAPVAFLLLLPFDHSIVRFATSVTIDRDFRRELESWQQYGAFGSLLFTSILIWRLDPTRTRRLLDLAAAAALVGVIVTLLKPLIGRVRPGHVVEGAPGFVPPWGRFVDQLPDGTTQMIPAWQAAERIWSMPSSHTAYAVILSVFLVALYPRLKWVGIGMVAFVGTARVLFGAHYPSDVIVGACLAIAIAHPAIHGLWGVRALDWIWIRFVDPAAQPAAQHFVPVEPSKPAHEAHEGQTTASPALAAAD